ncbi:hypothetical protein J2Z48_002798 [Croceifilum oryzae]|uniref:Uncharacterized protein n=1 Tax=Croceifilum oryzae TaxID=1553429 RepID=A0AAJ1TGR8_9BACL|nr:hypothetical protein [Croceifilum oryzae]MDQ0418595.1 hypothetical protein [Croceifilum oryzae]
MKALERLNQLNRDLLEITYYRLDVSKLEKEIIHREWDRLQVDDVKEEITI